MFWANTIGVYGFTATVPSVIEDLGYSSANAQLLTIPIYLAAMIVVLIFAFWSEKVQQRTPFIIAGYSIAVLGFIGQLAIPQTRLPGLTYDFLLPVAIALYSPFIQIVCLTANNLAPSSKRAMGMAILISIGNSGGKSRSHHTSPPLTFSAFNIPKHHTLQASAAATSTSSPKPPNTPSASAPDWQSAAPPSS